MVEVARHQAMVCCNGLLQFLSLCPSLSLSQAETQARYGSDVELAHHYFSPILLTKNKSCGGTRCRGMGKYTAESHYLWYLRSIKSPYTLN